MIPFCKSTIGEEEIQAASAVYRSGWMAPGPQTEAFEQEFAKYVGVKYAIFTGSCTAALKIAYKWARRGAALGNEGSAFALIPKNTFCATYAAASEVGVTWYYQEELGTKSPDAFRVNVHYGSIKDETPCLIEDSAHRIEPNDPLVGKIRCYSFYVTKNMTVGGQGGMFVTNDKDIYDFARLCWKDGLTTSTADRLSGNIVDYEVKLMAGGYDADDVRAAVGRVQLRKLPEMNRKRNAIVKTYNLAFDQDWQGNHLYPYFVKSVEDVYRLRQHLKERGIASGYHYPGPQNWLGVSLPLFPSLTQEECVYITEQVKEWQKKQ